MLEDRSYSYASDLWALGVMLYQFLTGKTPFKGKSQEESFELVKIGQFEQPNDIDPIALDLINKLIVLKPELRLGATNIEDLADHAFFAGINFSTIGNQLPPQKFELSPIQVSLAKYLPQNKLLKQLSLKKSSSNINIQGVPAKPILTMKKHLSHNVFGEEQKSAMDLNSESSSSVEPNDHGPQINGRLGFNTRIFSDETPNKDIIMSSQDIRTENQTPKFDMLRTETA